MNKTESIYVGIALAFKDGEPLPREDLDLIFNTAEERGFDPYQVPMSYLAKNIQESEKNK